MSKTLVERYSDLAEEYVFSAELLLEAYKSRSIDPFSDQKTKPLFSLLGHACECCLKSLAAKHNNSDEKELKNYGHDLVALMKTLNGFISNSMQELVFYLASSHYANDGKKTSYALRYADNNFDGDEEKRRKNVLLKKQKENGFSEEKPILIGSATSEQIQKLDPELSDYSRYLFSTTQMRPEPEFAIKTIRNDLDIAREAA